MPTDAILDTDIGGDPDDLFALLLAANSPEIDLRLVVTGDEVSGKRARLVKKVLDSLGRQVSVVQGVDLGGTNRFVVDELIADSTYAAETNYLGAIGHVIESSDRVLYVCIQAMSNLANLLKRSPEVMEKIQVYQMGGAISGSRQVGWAQHNLRIDPESARYVLHSGCEVHFVGSHTSSNPALMVDDQHDIFHRLRDSENKAHQILVRHCELYNRATGVWPNMHDPLTVSAAMGMSFVDFRPASISIYGDGEMALAKDGAMANLSEPRCKAKEFMQFLSDRLFGHVGR